MVFLTPCLVPYTSFHSISSDDSEDDIDLGTQCHLMDKVGLAEVALTELTHELRLSVSVSRNAYKIFHL